MKLATRRFLCSLAATAGGLLPLAAHAWWNTDWSERAKITLNTTAQGVETKEALSGAVVPVRLHSGDFDFLAAKPDGSDLKVIAADDKTPLKFWVERFDSANELAVIWVQLPSVAPGTDKNTIYVYAGNDKSASGSAGTPAIFDSASLAVFSFAEKAGPAQDSTGQIKSTADVMRERNGLIGNAARLDGQQPITFASDKLKAGASGPYTVSLWINPDASEGSLYKQGPLSLSLAGGKLSAELNGATAQGGDLPPSAWAQVAVTVGAGKLTLYVNGAQAAQADLANATTGIEGPVSVGEGYKGLIDQLEVASTVRSADWIKFEHAAQSADAKLVAAVKQTADSADEDNASPGYFGILVKNLTPDAWAVIGVLAVMFAIAAWVMINKALFVSKTDRANHHFLQRFRESHDVLGLHQAPDFRDSSLARLYQAGVRELRKREVGKSGSPALSGASLDAVKASIDADMVRETHQLNAKMVLLTIAISGGPFLGLLGTVVGVMITFAAIAAAGDVNVNAIAPGIAAALLATVAGLGVAIPSLFGYNYLASRIKNISSDMQIFVDEFVTRVAEIHGAR